MMKASDCHIILFAKAPIPGRVKTRLIPSMGAKAAAALSEQLIYHCLVTAVESGVGSVDLWCTPSTKHPFLIHCAEKFQVELHLQMNGNIGKRMAHAFHETLKIANYALLMGSDCPCLTRADLKKAVTALKEGMDAVISPAEDGGYVLIGLHHYTSKLFSGVSWGTKWVLEQTRTRLRYLGWQWQELPERWDVDRPEDVQRLMLEGYLKIIPIKGRGMKRNLLRSK
jgi:rSAM/selenodomain-associated transferase 1